MSRKEARVWAMKLVYQMEINKEFNVKAINDFLDYHDIQGNSREYIFKIVSSIINNQEDIDGKIKEYIYGWTFDRLAKIDLSILRIAITEIDDFEDIPSSVSINEAVEIAKEYSTQDAYKFVNGVLGSYVRKSK